MMRLSFQFMSTVVTTPDPHLNVYDLSGELLAEIRTYVTGRGLQQPTCMAFHPIKPIIAIGTMDRYLCAYGESH